MKLEGALWRSRVLVDHVDMIMIVKSIGLTRKECRFIDKEVGGCSVFDNERKSLCV